MSKQQLSVITGCTDLEGNSKEERIIGSERYIVYPYVRGKPIHSGTAFLGHKHGYRGRTTSIVTSYSVVGDITTITTLNTIYTLKKIGE